MMNGIQFQSVQTPNTLSSELRSVIRDNVLQFYVQGNGMDTQEEGITALYERLSQEDKLDGERTVSPIRKKFWNATVKIMGIPLSVTMTRMTATLERTSTVRASSVCLPILSLARSSAS